MLGHFNGGASECKAGSPSLWPDGVCRLERNRERSQEKKRERFRLVVEAVVWLLASLPSTLGSSSLLEPFEDDFCFCLPWRTVRLARSS